MPTAVQFNANRQNSEAISPPPKLGSFRQNAVVLTLGGPGA